MKLNYLSFMFLLAMPISQMALGGPTFNISNGEQKEISEKAGELLHEGLSSIHLMLSSLEAGEGEAASGHLVKSQAVLSEAQKKYEELEESLPAQNLPKPNPDKPEQAVSRKRLNDLIEKFNKVTGSEVRPPTKQRELAHLAVEMTKDLLTALSEMKVLPEDRLKRQSLYDNLLTRESILIETGTVVSSIWLE